MGFAKEYDLERFVAAQTYSYQTALAEISRGRKRSHWMWFIFPQIAGLGSSSVALTLKGGQPIMQNQRVAIALKYRN